MIGLDSFKLNLRPKQLDVMPWDYRAQVVEKYAAPIWSRKGEEIKEINLDE